jgi:predicted ArsR family transcriptional regulator
MGNNSGYLEARALANPTRRRLLRAVIDAGEPVYVADLTGLFGLHHTAIRQHLARLGDAGLVVTTTAPPRGRGRPRLAFRPTVRAAPALRPTGRYRELADMLAEAVRTGEGTRLTGQRIGQRIGSRRRGDDAVTVIVDEADHLGFEPTVHTRSSADVEVVLGHCPFQEVAAHDPATVCQLHLGLAEGIATSVGGISISGIKIRDPYRAGCRLMLHRRAASDPPPQPPRAVRH